MRTPGAISGYNSARRCMIRRISTMSLLCVGVLGCGSSATPANVAGQYTGPVVNGANSCPGNFVTDQMATVTVNVVQNDDNVSIRLQDLAALVLGAATGSTQFDGKVTGTHVDAMVIGSVTMTQSDCKYTMNANLSADFDGHILNGTVTYTGVPQNSSPDCSVVNGCSRQQTFALTLQPSTM
jgi:hypothetical protein